MIAPSSPVPAVERIELPGGWYFQQLNPPHGILYALRTPKGRGFGINGTGMSVGRPVVEAFVAAMSTPTPGRAAEPDAMAEVGRAVERFGNACRYTTGVSSVAKPGDQRAHDAAVNEEGLRQSLLSAVRTIVTERDEARTRAETAEAQLATLRAEVEELRGLSEKATSGEWHVTTCLDVWVQSGNLGVAQAGDESWDFSDSNAVRDQKTMEANGRLIAASVNFVRTLLSNPKADR